MKVTNTSGAGAATGAGKARGAGGGQGFSLPTVGGASTAPAAASVSSLSPVMNVGALLALQDVGSPTERKRKAVRRAARMLDALDEMKLQLLSGEPTLDSLGRLQQAIRDQREETEDPKLEEILNEIETRAAVELAKLEYASAASKVRA
ncbi:MAG: flagellar assembly protein FliX [Alphaproteobacteria bacterium PA2]|nr:MAG: flagellar assembly protein FliX [Alphaproteobacteria bacterium PA2]